MKKISLLFITFAALSCGNSTADNNNTKESNTSSTVQSTNDSSAKEVTNNNSSTKKYKGAFFDIQYPANFIAEGITPTNQGDEKGYDAAIFANEENTVGFYVFSPKHWYEPEDFLNALPYEKLSSEEKKENNGVIDHYKTFTAVDGSYTRSIQIRIDSNTLSNYVFGIQYKDQATYDQYKDAYLAFKKSLQQFD